MSAPHHRPPNLAHAASLPGHRVEFGRETPLVLDSGAELGPFTIAYQTYGRLFR